MIFSLQKQTPYFVLVSLQFLNNGVMMSPKSRTISLRFTSLCFQIKKVLLYSLQVNIRIANKFERIKYLTMIFLLYFTGAVFIPAHPRQARPS